MPPSLFVAFPHFGDYKMRSTISASSVFPAPAWETIPSLRCLQDLIYSSAFFFFFWLPHGIWSSQARDQILLHANTYSLTIFQVFIGNVLYARPGARSLAFISGCEEVKGQGQTGDGLSGSGLRFLASKALR